MAHKLVIVGSGPAGLTAALYAARANLEPLCIEGLEAGGQLMLTTEVENYPGFPKGLLGPEMMQLFREQAARFGTKFASGNVERVDFSKRPFKLWVDDELIEGKSVIIATGATAMWLGIPSETKLRGHGVSACATCDGFFFKDKNVAVVHRRDKLRASKIMQQKAMNNPKIKWKWNAVVTEVLGDKAVEGVRLQDVHAKKDEVLHVQGLFLAIGHKPNTEFLKGHIALDNQGYVIVKDNTKTSVKGVFVAGDVFDHRYRQAVTAAGSGCMAAIDAERWLEEK